MVRRLFEGVSRRGLVLLALLLAGLVAAALFAFFQLAPLGKAIRACADNYTGALVVGLDVKRLYALSFGLGAACVGAAGAIIVLIVDVTPPLGPAYTEAERRVEAHSRLERGTTCWLAGQCAEPNAYRYDAANAIAAVAALRRDPALALPCERPPYPLAGEASRPR